MQIRNFSIIAHIDHGKSTLSDRLLMSAGAITEREFKEQILDDMDLERERGITIKASAVTVFHVHNGEKYMLNFIDTPGHVDFHYEVQKALQACEGAILVVDATQGVQAQTVANAYAAIEAGLEIIPVINKIDLPSSRPVEVAEEIEQVLGFRAEECILVSAKTGQGIDELITQLCEKLPPPRGQAAAPARALIFDSIYDDYRGVITYVRVIDGELTKGQKIRFMGTNKLYQVTDLAKRWKDDVLDHNPDVVSIKIGINDVWHGLDKNINAGVPIEQFVEMYHVILRQLQAVVPKAKVVLCQPTVIEPPAPQQGNAALQPYVRAVGELRREFAAAAVVPLHAAFVNAKRMRPDIAWTPDGVHPSSAGHMLIARTWLAETGLL